MSASWVAAGVRARALSRRRVGAAGARDLAALPSLDAAVQALVATPYGHDVHPGMTLAQAQHAVSATVLWHLRVLAGWLPHGDARIVRVLAGGFEVANVDEHLRSMAGLPAGPTFELGSLSTAWPRIAAEHSREGIRAVLAASPWGDPGDDAPRMLHLGMRVAWLLRVGANVPAARPWAHGAAAILVARECMAAGTRPGPELSRGIDLLVGRGWRDARLGTLAEALPSADRWALADVSEPADLWRAEAAWWRRVSTDAATLLRKPVSGPDPVVGAVGALGADAWRVRAALEVAARAGTGSGTIAREAFDAVA